MEHLTQYLWHYPKKKKILKRTDRWDTARPHSKQQGHKGLKITPQPERLNSERGSIYGSLFGFLLNP